MFGNAVNIQMLSEMRIDYLESGTYILEGCHVGRLKGNVNILQATNCQIVLMGDDSVIGKVTGYSIIKEMRGRARIGQLCDVSKVEKMNYSAQIVEMKNHTAVEQMLGDTMIHDMSDSAVVCNMAGHSTVKNMMDETEIIKLTDHASARNMIGKSRIYNMDKFTRVERMGQEAIVFATRDCALVEYRQDNALVCQQF